MQKAKIGIANWTEHSQRLRLVAIIELRVGDCAGDLSERGFKTVTLEPCPPGALTVSFTHETIDRSKRKGSDAALVSIGAGLPDVPAYATFDAGWSAERYAALQKLAERWHLNTMRSGCVHQIAEGWGARPIDPSQPTNRYGRWFDGQKSDSWNLLGWIRPDEHPEGLLTRPCPECGYPYGSAWLVEPLPPEVLAELADLGVTPPLPVG